MIRVLLVDDDALVRSGLRIMLAGATGIEVAGEAGDGREVLAAVDRHRPDVVLMDIRMPAVDGIDIFDANVEHCRARGAHGIVAVRFVEPEEADERVAEVALGLSTVLADDR